MVGAIFLLDKFAIGLSNGHFSADGQAEDCAPKN